MLGFGSPEQCRSHGNRQHDYYHYLYSHYYYKSGITNSLHSTLALRCPKKLPPTGILLFEMDLITACFWK